MSQISSILEANGKQIVKDLQESLRSKGLNASGQTSQSISYNVEETLNKTILSILSNRSIGALQFGRRAGKQPPGDVIRKWIDDKPIQPQGSITKDQLAFLIARKIGREGIKVPNRYNPGGAISDVINQNLIDEIFKEVVQASINRLKTATVRTKEEFAA